MRLQCFSNIELTSYERINRLKNYKLLNKSLYFFNEINNFLSFIFFTTKNDQWITRTNYSIKWCLAFFE
jgi:hypothetical protein